MTSGHAETGFLSLTGGPDNFAVSRRCLWITPAPPFSTLDPRTDNSAPLPTASLPAPGRRTEAFIAPAQHPGDSSTLGRPHGKWHSQHVRAPQSGDGARLKQARGTRRNHNHSTQPTARHSGNRTATAAANMFRTPHPSDGTRLEQPRGTRRHHNNSTQATRHTSDRSPQHHDFHTHHTNTDLPQPATLTDDPRHLGAPRFPVYWRRPTGSGDAGVPVDNRAARVERNRPSCTGPSGTAG